MRTKGPDFIKGNTLLGPDPAIGAVIADVQDICNLIDERKVWRQVILDVLEKNLLDIGLFHGLAN